MQNTSIVSNKSELKQALKIKAARIVITNIQLANHIRVVSMASKAVVTAVIAGGAISATQFWNPVGWGAAAFTAGISGTTLVAITALGLGVATYALSQDYRFVARGSYSDSDGNTYDAEAVLERN